MYDDCKLAYSRNEARGLCLENCNCLVLILGKHFVQKTTIAHISVCLGKAAARHEDKHILAAWNSHMSLRNLLSRYELGVVAVLDVYEFFMVPFLNDIASVKHTDLVCVADG